MYTPIRFFNNSLIKNLIPPFYRLSTMHICHLGTYAYTGIGRFMGHAPSCHPLTPKESRSPTVFYPCFCLDSCPIIYLTQSLDCPIHLLTPTINQWHDALQSNQTVPLNCPKSSCLIQVLLVCFVVWYFRNNICCDGIIFCSLQPQFLNYNK